MLKYARGSGPILVNLETRQTLQSPYKSFTLTSRLLRFLFRDILNTFTQVF